MRNETDAYWTPEFKARLDDLQTALEGRNLETYLLLMDHLMVVASSCRRYSETLAQVMDIDESEVMPSGIALYEQIEGWRQRTPEK